MIGDRIGLAALVAAVDDTLGDPPQIFDQDDAQGDRRGPQFADRERLLLLIGVDEGAPGIDIEAAVGVRDERPDQPEHPRQPGEGTVGELGQLAIISRREVQPHFANLALDEMEIVDQPFRGGGDRGLVVHRRADRAIGVDQARFIGCQAVEQRTAQLAVRLDGLGAGQASRMLLHPLGARELFANGRRIVPRRRRRALERPAEERRQGKGQGQRLGDVEIKACSSTLVGTGRSARALAAGTENSPRLNWTAVCPEGFPKRRNRQYPAIGPFESVRFLFWS